MNNRQGELLRNTRRLSFVPRWVVAPTIRHQNVAEHSFHVACICDVLLSYHALGTDTEFRLDVLRHAMYHDADEAYTGDGPSPSKDSTRKPAEHMTPREIVVKVADCIEAYLFCDEEQAMGNRTMHSVQMDVFQRGEKYWAFFMWDENIGTRWGLATVLSEVLSETKLHRHPILEAPK